MELSFDFENVLVNLGATLPSPGPAIPMDQASLTSTQPWRITGDPLIPDLNWPSLESPFRSNFEFEFENTFANSGARPLSPIREALTNQMAAESSTPLDSIHYRRLGDGIPGSHRDHAFDDNVQLALTGLHETLLNDKSHSSLDLWPQGYQSQFQVGLQTTSVIELPGCSKISFSSQFARFEEFLRTQGVSFIAPGRAGPGRGSPLFRGFTSKFIADVVLSRQHALTRRVSDLETALGRLGTLIPGENTTLTTKDEAFKTNFTRVLLFSMLNGFAGFDHIPMEDMLKFFDGLSITSQSFLAALKKCSTPAARTFVNTIFRASIEAEDNHILKQLLKHDLVDVNAPVCWRGQYPLEQAASLQAHGLIATLLHYGADVNKTRMGNDRESLFSKLMQPEHSNRARGFVSIRATFDTIKTIDLLLRAGAKVILDDVLRAGRLFPAHDIARRLSLAILPSDHRHFFTEKGAIRANMASVSHFLDDTQGSQIIQNMMNLCETAGCNSCLTACASSVRRAAVEAAKLGRLKVVRLLIGHVPSPTKLLCAAIKSNRKDLIDFVLSFNPDLDPPAQRLERPYGRRHTTPLEAAVRTGNVELINYLVTKNYDFLPIPACTRGHNVPLSLIFTTVIMFPRCCYKRNDS
ncbi:hypothetical protein ANO14919_129130 [Xylariales sp. No.14919]|nr:hypothetical protein ANO14919_129130 [Xylariales sp. No.14919]